ncbi:MAG: amino acid adenylation domain-containing protein [Hyphomicrobiaceae bacterium]|nr:amino acid adenylation domain-containing protein [Hyphomicrobiaceae bacterium]
MSATDLRSKLTALGIELAAEAGQLRVRARPGVLTPELQAEIARSKAALLALLATETGAPGAAPPALARVPRDGALPLSFFQERVWVIQRLDPDSAAFNMVLMWPSERPTTSQQRAARLRTIVSRHEVLRCLIDGEGETPLAHPLRPDAVAIDVIDLSQLSQDDQLARLAADRSTAARRPFNLAAEPPARFAVYDIGQGRVVTLIAAHHIAIDAWSATLLRREIEAEALGDAPAGALQYADFAAWQRRLHETTDLTASLDWWARRLAGSPQLSAFPADRTPAAQGTGAVLAFSWDRQLADGIRALARAQGATLYMALVAACAAVLGRHAHQDDIVLGSPTGIRELYELETVVGPFVNLLVLRLDLSDDPPFTELLARARAAVLDAHEHRHTPFEKLVERLQPARSLNRSPIFQTAVVLHNAEQDRDLEILGGGAIHDMTWFVRETGDGIGGSLEYRSDIYAAQTMARILRHLETFLRSAVAAPGRPVSALALVSPQERGALVSMGQSQPTPVDLTPFPRQFERQVASAPSRVAVTFGEASLTYDALNRRANRIARHLMSLGAGKGACVGVCQERGLDLLATLIAIQKCGAAYLPVDPRHPAERRAYMLQDSGCALLVVDAATADVGGEADGIRLLDVEADAGTIAGLDDGDLPVAPQAADPVYLIYTSGSTGKPKGVAVSHGNLANFLGSMRREPGLSSDDILAAVTTISFDIAGLELYLPLLVGARIELVDQETATDGEFLKARLAHSGATLMQATPATWRQLVEADWTGGAGFRALCGGEGLPRDLADQLLKRVGALWNLYGPTETTVWSTLERITRDSDPIGIGRPIANTDIYILDRHGEPVPVGVPGEIFIGGAGVAIGYHARPELTAQRFVADRFSGRSGARLYATGDLGRCASDGRYLHLGRLDAQVKVRGMRIELGEIETALAAIAEVQSGIVVAREPSPGEGRLVAYVVYRPGQDLTVSEVRRHLRKTLPDYMIPSVVVALDAVPLTPNGKVDRTSLPDPFKSSGRAAGAEPPAPGVEQQMAEIWREFLKVESIGAEDNFFELGGQSLLSLRVAAAVERRLGRRMDPRALFFQTLRQVSAQIANAPLSTRRSSP